MSVYYILVKLIGKDPAQYRGWQSQRFCVYPQELVLQFPCLVHLKQLQFLVHQNKIPSRVELWAYAPDFGAGSAAGNLVSHSNPNITFTRLGHFSLDDNLKTNYQARELKTVYLEQYCQYLKIVLHKCHHNQFNIFNQIGMVAITAIGSYMGEYEVAMISTNPVKNAYQGDFGTDPGLMPRNLKLQSVNDDDLDPTIQDKIRTLQSAKVKAVDTEDFDKAKSLKEVIDKLKVAGQQLVQLELKKKLAIENDDFDSAKVLKYEIDRLRAMAMTLDTERVILSPIRQTRGAPSHFNADQDNFEDFRSQRPLDDYDQPPITQSDHGGYEELKEAHDRSFKQQPEQFTERSYHAQSRAGLMGRAGNEDLVVPALNMKKPIDFNTVDEDDFNNNRGASSNDQDDDLKIQNIPPGQRPIADALVPLFGEATTLLVFARSWQKREQGIQEVINSLAQVMSKADADANVNSCLLGLMTECLKDKVQQITLKSFQLVEAYATALSKAKAINPKGEISNTEKMLAQLLDKLADSKFSQKAETSYLKFFSVDSLEGNFLIGFLLKANSYLNKKLASSFKHQVPRLRLLNRILTDFDKYESAKKTSAQTFPFTLLFNKLKEGIEASNQEQRKLSCEVLFTVYQKFGFKKVEPAVAEMSVKSLEMLMKEMPEVETYIKMKKQQASKKE